MGLDSIAGVGRMGSENAKEDLTDLERGGAENGIWEGSDAATSGIP